MKLFLTIVNCCALGVFFYSASHSKAPQHVAVCAPSAHHACPHKYRVVVTFGTKVS